ncbi:hypothetical protein HDV04_003290 [Boothiomyces sp. JEL0838]|nr:hypothetical protein HDV04_003268 [Boothiomyces sp. JEL0838]KAJ3312269.1 hypothetical protein HDV04_003290 [Boothiomyces sp. JEL0838]
MRIKTTSGTLKLPKPRKCLKKSEAKDKLFNLKNKFIKIMDQDDRRKSSGRRVSFAATAHVRLFEKDSVDSSEHENQDEAELAKMLSEFHPAESTPDRSANSENLFDIGDESKNSFDVSLTGSPNLFNNLLAKNETPVKEKMLSSVIGSSTPLLDSAIKAITHKTQSPLGDMESFVQTPTGAINSLEMIVNEHDTPTMTFSKTEESQYMDLESTNTPSKFKVDTSSANTPSRIGINSPLAKLTPKALKDTPKKGIPKITPKKARDSIAPFFNNTPKSSSSLKISHEISMEESIEFSPVAPAVEPTVESPVPSVTGLFEDSMIESEEIATAIEPVRKKNVRDSIAGFFKRDSRGRDSISGLFTKSETNSPARNSPVTRSKSVSSTPKINVSKKVRDSLAGFFPKSAINSPQDRETISPKVSTDSSFDNSMESIDFRGRSPTVSILKYTESPVVVAQEVASPVKLESPVKKPIRKPRDSVAPFFTHQNVVYSPGSVLDDSVVVANQNEPDLLENIESPEPKKTRTIGGKNVRDSIAPFFAHASVLDESVLNTSMDQSQMEEPEKVTPKKGKQRKIGGKNVRDSIAPFFAHNSILDDSVMNTSDIGEQIQYFKQESEHQNQILENIQNQDSLDESAIEVKNDSLIEESMILDQSQDLTETHIKKIEENNSFNNDSVDFSLHLDDKGALMSTPHKEKDFSISDISPVPIKAETPKSAKRSATPTSGNKTKKLAKTPISVVASPVTRSQRKVNTPKQATVTPLRRAVADKIVASAKKANTFNQKLQEVSNEENLRGEENKPTPKRKGTKRKSLGGDALETLKREKLEDEMAEYLAHNDNSPVESEVASPAKGASTPDSIFSPLKPENVVFSPDKTRDLMEEEQLPIMDTSLLQDDPEPKQILNIEDFLKATGIVFKDSYSEPELVSETIELNSVTNRVLSRTKIIEQVCYEQGCEELKVTINDLFETINGFSEDMSENVPLLFEEYAQGTDLDRDEILLNLQTSKKYCYLEARLDWYPWKRFLFDKIFSNLESSYALLKKDLEIVKAFSERYSIYGSETSEYKNQLIESIAETKESNDKKTKELAQEHSELMARKVDRLSKLREMEHEIARLQAENQTFEADIQNLVVEEADLKNKISNSEKVCKELVVFDPADLVSLRSEYSILLMTHSWRPLEISTQAISWVYSDALSVTFSKADGGFAVNSLVYMNADEKPSIVKGPCNRNIDFIEIIDPLRINEQLKKFDKNQRICRTVDDMSQNTTIMMRKKDCYVNATQILKALGINKNDRFHLLSEEIQKYPHEKITGGYAAYQGTWIPLKSARSLALALNVLPQLAPLFDYDVNSGLAESNHRLLVKYRRKSSDTLDSAETVTNSLNQSESNMQYKGNATEQYYNAGYPWVYPSPQARPFRPVPRPAMIPNVNNSPQINQHRQTDIHNANFRPVTPMMYYRPFPIPHRPPQGHPLNYHPYYNSPQNVNAPSPYKSPDIHFQKKIKIDRSQLVSSPPNKLRAEEVTSQRSSPAKENCQSSNNHKGLGMCKSCNNTMSVAILAIPCGHSFCDNCLLKIQRGASNSSKMICPCCQKPVEHHVRNLALEEVLKKDKNVSKSPELVETNVLEDPVQLAQKYQEQLDMIDKRLVNLEKETGEIEINVKDKLSKLEKSKSVIKKAEDGISKITANIEQLKNRLETLDGIVQENLPIQTAIEKSIQNYQSRMIDLSHEKSALTERKEKVYSVWKGLGNISQ